MTEKSIPYDKFKALVDLDEAGMTNTLVYLGAMYDAGEYHLLTRKGRGLMLEESPGKLKTPWEVVPDKMAETFAKAAEFFSSAENKIREFERDLEGIGEMSGKLRLRSEATARKSPGKGRRPGLTPTDST